MTNQYSLADYTLTVSFVNYFNKLTTDGTSADTHSFTIGGPAETSNDKSYGGYIGNITVNRTESLWSTSGDYTGGYVHNKNLNKTGTVSVQINQLSDAVIKLIKIFELYYDDDATINLTITNIATNTTIALCTDCKISTIPQLSFGNSATTQPWTFTCGVIDFPLTNL